MSNYDVAVLGAGLPGLAAAVLLARAHQRVVIIDPASLPGGVLASKVIDGITFAAGPVVTQGFEPGGPLRAFYATIGLPISLPAGLQAYQVALPDRRITVYADLEGTLEELRREFASEIDTIAAIVRDLQASSIKHAGSRLSSALAQRRSARSFLQSRRISSELFAFFDVQARFFFGRTLQDLSLAEFVTMVVHAPMHLPSGFHGLAEQLRELFTAAGGTYRTEKEWPVLRIGAGRRASVTLRGEQYEPRSIIANIGCDADRTVFLGIREEGLPVAMLENVLYLASYERPDDICALTIFGGPSPAAGPDRIRPLTATFFGRQIGIQSRGELLAHIRSIIPFLDQNVRLQDELDLTSRTIPFPDQLADAYTAAPKGPELQTVRSVKHFYVLKDSAHAVNRSIGVVRKLAESLSRS